MPDFRFHIPITAWSKSEDANPMRIGGIVSTGSLDRQQERVVQDGLNFKPFLQHGWFNDNHGQKTTDVLGYPTKAFRVRKGEKLPNGKVSTHDGWWAEGYLVNTDEGRKVFALARSLSKGPSDRGLGFSIEGKVGKRDKQDSQKITSADVHNVAITHVPVNTDTSLAVLAKALIAGDAIVAPNPKAGDGFPLRTESLDGDLYTTEYDDEDDDDLDEYDLPAGPNGGVSKALSSTGLTTIDYIEYLTDALGDWNPSEPEAETVSKAEAEAIVAASFPHWTEQRIANFLSGGLK